MDHSDTFIKLIEQDIEWYLIAAGTWDALEKSGIGHLQDLDGKTVATASQMAEGYRAKAQGLKDLLSKLQ